MNVLVTYKSQGEIVVEEVRLLRRGLAMCVRRVDLHLVLGLVEDPGRRAEGGDDVLD